MLRSREFLKSSRPIVCCVLKLFPDNVVQQTASLLITIFILLTSGYVTGCLVSKMQF